MSSSKSERRRVRREEEEVARALGGRRTFNSGAGDEKGDGTVGRRYYRTEDGQLREVDAFAFRIENKMTRRPDYRLSAQDWEDLRNAAARSRQVPLFVVRVVHAGFPVRLVILDQAFARGLFEPGPTQGFGKTARIRVEFSYTNPPHTTHKLATNARIYELVSLEWDWFLHLLETV